MTHIAEDVHYRLIALKKTLTIAESCTGGALAASLTTFSGASEYFLGGIVAYSNHLKIRLLNVAEATLSDQGAVSKETVQQMANGMMAIISCDYSIAVSGIAGPNGGSTEKPVGTIWAAIKDKNEGIDIWTFHLSGDRKAIIQGTIEVILGRLYTKLQVIH